jgi:hypothetical protein
MESREPEPLRNFGHAGRVARHAHLRLIAQSQFAEPEVFGECVFGAS